MPEATLEKTDWTYNDYLSLDDDKRYEILEGKLIMTPAPGFSHQNASRKLEFIIMDFVEKRKLGIVIYAPFDIIIKEDTVIQPDILFISKENQDKLEERGFFGAPDLVVEIISPSSYVIDTVIKKEIYEKNGVKEYWLVDVKNRAVEVFELRDKSYDLFSSAVEKGRVKSKVLEGLEVDVEGIF